MPKEYLVNQLVTTNNPVKVGDGVSLKGSKASWGIVVDVLWDAIDVEWIKKPADDVDKEVLEHLEDEIRYRVGTQIPANLKVSDFKDSSSYVKKGFEQLAHIQLKEALENCKYRHMVRSARVQSSYDALIHRIVLRMTFNMVHFNDVRMNLYIDYPPPFS